jgi:hypothetical protein
MDTLHDDLYESIQVSLEPTGLPNHSKEKTKENLTYAYQLLYTKTKTLSNMFKEQ